MQKVPKIAIDRLRAAPSAVQHPDADVLTEQEQLAAEYAYRFAGVYDLAWWVDAEQPGLIGDQFAALGMALGCVDPGAGIEAVRSAVLGQLREQGRWLLVFDNAEDPGDITGWLPGGDGRYDLILESCPASALALRGRSAIRTTSTRSGCAKAPTARK